MLDDLAELNAVKFREHGDPEIATRIAQYEMAFRMQTSVPELADISREPKSVLDLYGPSVREQGSYAYNCLMARRLIERGVRTVQVMHAGWDQHNSLTTELYTQCRDTDQPSAGLVADLKQRGLLDSTVVQWGGEMGRLPVLHNDAGREKWGRDHNTFGFSYWAAGGGFKSGHIHGETDEWGHKAVKDVVNHYDWHATLLHCFGFDHAKLGFIRNAANMTLTDGQNARVIGELLS
jgi:hypothetical protein